MKTRLSTILCSLVLLCGCTGDGKMKLIPETNFEKTVDGKQVKLFTLENNAGITVQITNYGGRVVSLWTPDRDGKFEDIVLGYENIDDYLGSNEIYYGALIGRYGNRIAKGEFTQDSVTYKLAKNNDANHLHGGIKGFNNVVWDADMIGKNALRLRYLSPDGEEGYPGNLSTEVLYTLGEDNSLGISYKAVTDKPTPVNLTHHSFFNLHGAGKAIVNDHIIQIEADRFIPVDQGLIPTGELRPVENTPMDFREPQTIASRVDQSYEQLVLGKGYDHCWVLNNKFTNGVKPVAKAYEPKSGRTLEVYTTEPGMQLYGGNFLSGKDIGKWGETYEFREAFCFETQHFPDTPNQPTFPSTRLNPGETYTSLCIYKFGVE